MDGITVSSFSELTARYAKSINALVIIRGLRAVSDFEFEFQMALMNRKIEPTVETVFLMPNEKYSYLSSSLIKDIARRGGDISSFVPDIVKEKSLSVFQSNIVQVVEIIMNEELNEILRNRRQKLDKLREQNINPFPFRYERTHLSTQVISNFDLLESGATTVRVAGRLMSIRSHGKTLFAHVKDGAGLIQIYLKRDDIGLENFERFNLCDMGDIIGVEGTVFKTHTGEITIRVSSFELLTKSLQPLPEKWHGLQDKELRYRRRYLDLLANSEVLETFQMRTKIINALRTISR